MVPQLWGTNQENFGELQQDTVDEAAPPQCVNRTVFGHLVFKAQVSSFSVHKVVLGSCFCIISLIRLPLFICYLCALFVSHTAKKVVIPASRAMAGPLVKARKELKYLLPGQWRDRCDLQRGPVLAQSFPVTLYPRFEVPVFSKKIGPCCCWFVRPGCFVFPLWVFCVVAGRAVGLAWVPGPAPGPGPGGGLVLAWPCLPVCLVCLDLSFSYFCAGSMISIIKTLQHGAVK